MYVTSVSQSEIRLTLDATVEIANALDNKDATTPSAARLRKILDTAGFSRAAQASEASMARLDERMHGLLPLLHDLPNATATKLTPLVNAELAKLAISPSLIDHDGIGLHMHWTPTDATFDDQIMSDILIALAQELCDNGAERFGHCAAHDCEDLFYDATRNRSKRFCADPRCAGRTHTADHRARQRQSNE